MTKPKPFLMKLTLVVSLFCFISALHADTDIHAWSKISKPTASKTAQSIGKYTAGCLRGAIALPKDGPGYQVMRLSRNRYFGHPNLTQFIQNLGHTAYNQGLGTLLIGDLGLARGGPTLTGHRSHQTGLDVDIWYLLAKEAEKRELTLNEREQWNAPSVLTASANAINLAQWSATNEKILKAAAQMPEVDRIFVNAHIKKQLCKDNSNYSWLQKIRPWYAHADHFHVRLRCSSSDSRCDKQEPVPAGNGCDADLAWWFTDEAKKPTKKEPPKPPILPKECDAVLVE
jgi:penicillin-insensitive murein DD-endopeptidase